MSGIIDPDLPDGWTLHVLDGSELYTGRDVLELWARERVLPKAEAFRRVDEAFLVAADERGSVIGVVTAWVAVHPQLRAPVWQTRAFVAPEHRRSNAARVMAATVYGILEDRFVAGADAQAAGILFTIENEALAAYYVEAVTPYVDFWYVGASPRGEPLFLRWFPGATLPAVPSGSTR